ncbi:MAG: transposase [Halioglobus sp.]|nr:transposase [Halioglobus sp.]
MDELSVPVRRRRRHSPEFKAKVVAACQGPGVSVASVALEHGLNANMVRLWIKASRTPSKSSPATFVPLALPAPTTPSTVAEDTIRIEVPCASGTIAITWPASHADRALPLLRELLL